MRKVVSEWADRNGIATLWPEQFSIHKDESHPVLSLADSFHFQKNVCIDYGKFIERVPFFVLRPQNVEQLVASVAFLKEQLIPYKIRGAAHSAGGQVLTDRGAVIDLSEITRIIEDEPERQEILVEGGIWWLHLAEYLHGQGRRPRVLTDNLRTTVAGTLAVGGFGDTSHLYGPQIASVTELTLITPDGNKKRIHPSDRLFQFVLAGRGQLGIIAEARIKTLARSSTLAVRVVRWHSVPDYVEDAIRVIERGSHEFSRMRIQFSLESQHRNSVVGVIGNFRDDIPQYDEASDILKHGTQYPYELLDFFEHYSHDPSESWKLCSPSVEMVFPLPDGLKVWQKINREILKSGLYQFLPRGSSIMVFRRNSEFPLAPFPDTDFCMLIAIRPAMNLHRVQDYLPLLQRFEVEVLQSEGKIYLMSIEPEVPNFLEMQFGEALEELIELKRKLDPDHLLNPGLLPPAAGVVLPI